MESKKINQLATSVNPSTSDLAIIGDPITGVSKKITWLQVSSLIGTAANLQQVTDNGATTTNPITIGGLTISGLSTGVLKSDSGVISSVPFGGANGVATLGGDGKVPSNQLPSYVDDVVEVANYAALPATGETGKIYITLDNNKVYRWTGSTYVEIAANNAVWGAITGTLSNQTDLQNALDAKVPTSRTLSINGTSYDLSANRSWSVGSVTSVGLTSTAAALTITNSPITSSGNIGVNFAGSSTQYVAGDGSLVTFPTIVTEAQNLITEVYNETGATLTKGTIVYINGGHGNLPTITKALATGDSTSAQTYGVVQADITNNNNGYVVATGRISNLDTQAYAAGTQLYLSPSTAGTWTSTKPYAPYHLVYVGIVVRSHPTQGIVEVKIMNGFELEELHNVSAQSPSNNDGIFYNTSTSLWEKKSVATALGYTPISGSGTTNYIPKFTGSTALGDSLIFDNGTNVGIGTASPSHKLDVSGTARFTGQLRLDSTITNGTYTYTLPSATGTLAIRSDLDAYVTLGTSQVITGAKVFDGSAAFSSTGGVLGIEGGASVYKGLALAKGFPPSIFVAGFSTLYSASGNNNAVFNDNSNTSKLQFQATSSYTYTFPANTGTIALTSDIPVNSVTSVTATSPLFSSGGLTPNITIQVATSGQNGYLSSTDWNTFNGKQNALTNPITGTGSSGRIPYFSDTTTLTSNANLNWDNSNNFITTSGVYVYNNTTNAYLLTSNGDNVGTVFNVSATRWGLGYSLSPSTLATAALSWNSEGRVSIGNTNNTYNLDVTGTGRFTGDLTANGVTIGASDIRSSSNVLTLGGTSEVMRITGGNVGIGTSSPTVSNITGTSLTLLQVTNSGGNGQVRVGGSSAVVGLTLDYNNSGNTISTIRSQYGSSSNDAAMFFDSGYIAFRTSTSFAERMRILSNGSVAINMTTAPYGNVSIKSTNSTSYYGFNLYAANNGNFTFLNHDNNRGVIGTEFGVGGTGHTPLAFEAGGSERMRITSGGFTKQSNNGTYSYLANSSHETSTSINSNYIDIIAHRGTTPYGIYIIYNNASPNSGSDNEFIACSDSTQAKFFVYSNGNLQNRNGVYGTISSDLRLKENIVSATSKLDDILKLNVVNFNLIDDTDKKKQIGFIAQEFKEVFPSLVYEKDTREYDEDGNVTKGLKDSLGLNVGMEFAILVKAVQELEARIKTLENK